ncbi:MAG: hypothetical protein PHR96_05300 [Clostridia bacterium]|nr:hypothetical protein [Clostridia bacterium]
MAFFKKLISFGSSVLKEDSAGIKRSKYYVDPNSITTNEKGQMFCFNKLVIDGKQGFKQSEVVFYGKEDESDAPAYYLKANGNKATLLDLKGVDSSIWISTSALNYSPFLSENEKDPKFDSRPTIQKTIDAYQDLKNLSEISLEEYTKLRREIFEYLNPNITNSKCERVEFLLKHGQSDSSPRITKNPITNKLEVLYVPKGLNKDDFEKQHFEKYKSEIEKQKANNGQKQKEDIKKTDGYIMAGVTSSDDSGEKPKSVNITSGKATLHQQKQIEIVHN